MGGRPLHEALVDLLTSDGPRMRALEAVRSLDLPDCWIAAGFVRNAMWDYLHGYPPDLAGKDVDVVWFDSVQTDADLDLDFEAQLAARAPGLGWSVKNQARMHLRNGDSSYGCVAHAMTFWPETATAIGARLSKTHEIEINAPFGLDDLFALRLVPTTSFAEQKRHIFEERIASKSWLSHYPKLTQGDAPL